MELEGRDLVQRCPGLELVAVGGAVRLHDHEHRRVFSGVTATAALARVLARCGRWRPRAAVELEVAELLSLDHDAAVAIVAMLLRLGLLVDSDCGVGDERRRSGWSEHGWKHAYSYQRHTELLPKINWSAPNALRTDVELMRSYLRAEPSPASYKCVEADLCIELPKVWSPFGSLGDALRSAAPAAPHGPINKQTLGTFLYFSFGQTGIRSLPVTGRHVTKTTPSGGSRHPSEAYPIVVDVDDVPPGIYHYNVEHHRLDRVASGDFLTALRHDVIIHPDRPAFEIKLGVVLTSVVERSMFRYRESRSYRVLHHDIGHLLQTVAVLAHGFGWQQYRGYTLRDRAVEALLGVERLAEPALAYVVIG